MNPLNFCGNSRPFFLIGFKDFISEKLPDARLVRGDGNHGQSVDLPDLRSRLPGRAAHPRQPMEAAEKALETQARHGLGWVGNLHAFPGFDGLMEAFTPGALRHGAAGEFIDNHDLPIHDDILLVAVEKLPGVQCLSDQFATAVPTAPEAGQAGGAFLQLPDSGGGQFDLMVMEVRPVILAGHEVGGELTGGQSRLFKESVLAGRGDDQRRDGLINKHTIRLVHNRGMESTHDQPILRHGARGEKPPDEPPGGVGKDPQSEAVAEEIGEQFLTRRVSDIGGVALLTRGGLHRPGDTPDPDSAELVKLAQPGGVALDEVIINRDNVTRQARPSRQHGGEARGQRLALARRHLSEIPAMQGQSSHELHGKGAESKLAVGRLPDGGQSGKKHRLTLTTTPAKLLPEPQKPFREHSIAHLDPLASEGINGGSVPVQTGDNGRAALPPASPAIDHGVEPPERARRSPVAGAAVIVRGNRSDHIW